MSVLLKYFIILLFCVWQEMEFVFFMCNIYFREQFVVIFVLFVRVDDGGGLNIKNKGVYYFELFNKLMFGFMKLNSFNKE